MIEFLEISGQRRSVYRQLDGTIELADACSCERDPLACPIDDHQILARRSAVEAEKEVPR